MQHIADTGFLVAYWSRNDQHHAWARSLVLRPPLITYAPVLTEAAYLLGREEPLLQMLEEGDMVSTFDMDANASRLMQWIGKYADTAPGLTDACVVRLAEMNPRAEILTTDRRDFSMYRTLAGKPLKCVFPPVD